ncbi:MAG TPA: acetyl-CoA carboxylase biotin carboxyl carrier protein [Saprospiraceae bacterium]|nr:acetyl-CoA carboxylase biotin carboxyl carrier protein [Saprospiraceae bacterium]HMP24670.1 acetyl-CoA carboxylase biotin carboxyl carrier protein [Saprospiraceae bacterium]
MNFKEIQELIKLVGRSDLAEFKMKDGEFELSIRTKFYNAGRQQVVQTMAPAPATLPAPIASAPAPAPAPQAGNTEAAPAPKSAETAPKSDKKYLEIKSPIVGTFYRSSSPDKPAYVKVGDRVEAGNVVCIIEAMKLFNEIESEITGTIVKVMVDDAQPVEYDQVLFLLEA